ncbi:chaperone protein htpG [Aspergillus terreus]|uniref:Chaperone protein htpG n=1 Tax=Aspergillus terreus TaxID=33178 RepID=A0A5M3YZY6_ASPTE|nr:hypothetical protein ATETN484_0007000400 [Aspergillus terreus]GFF19345.1 chaperone protein htpG [Aspergillus terreus]
MASHTSARDLVRRIAKGHGHLGEETLQRMDPETRREVEEALLKKDELIGSTVITLAKNVYNSSARFVFELLQNADDNSYSKARSRSVAPYVSFRVYPRKIVVECNEDGFTHENLVAICNVGQSSKSGAQGYIGEKGIGFKSVFMVAWKVLIQSGEFSFYFQHKIGDSGMGMISPIWQETDEKVPDGITRITLFLHDRGPDEVLAKQRETTLQQFRDLQATFLLFLKNLRRIEVRIYNDAEEETSSVVYSMEYQLHHLVKLAKEMQRGETTHVDIQHFHITKEIVAGLPKSENRNYTESEDSSKAYAKSEIVLAFPLTHDYVPVIEPQDVFAFLPIRRIGFSFLIHADFVTDASRQDIVQSSARNLRLLGYIAQVFVKAVSQFCQHTTLRSQWMRYVPRAHATHWDGFWAQLLDKIRLHLAGTPVLWTRSHKQLRCIGNMRRLPSRMHDKNGDPLLGDLQFFEQYLASEYLARDLELLKEYGLLYMNEVEFLDRVHQDLDRGESSVIRSSTDEDWHSRVAKILVSALSADSQRVRQLPLIPLIDREWKSASSIKDKAIYYSHCEGYPVPNNLALNLVSPQAEKLPARRELFDCLGVVKPQVSDVRRAIVRRNAEYKVSRENSRRHLRFLYLTAHLDRSSDSASGYNSIRLFDSQNRRRPPQTITFFFPDTDPYCAERLLGPSEPKGADQGAPGLDVSILHPYYMEDCPTPLEDEDRSWKTWLSEARHVRDTVPLTRSGSLSEECLYIAKHRPERFLGFLVKAWKHEGAIILADRSLTKALLAIKVLCENGDMYPLGETYVPAPELGYARQFLTEGEFFPWLQVDTSLCNGAWLSSLSAMAKSLSFGFPQSELEFYLTVLGFVAKASRNAKGPLVEAGRVFDLYSRIQARCSESATPNLSRDMIREKFTSQSLIYIPQFGDEDDNWVWPCLCLWEAPEDMICKHPLKSRYKNVEKGTNLPEFFQNTLQIRNVRVNDFLDDLYELWGRGPDCFSEVYRLYLEIDKRRSGLDHDAATAVREIFEKKGFIYYAGGGDSNWHRPSQCLWSTTTDIKGMVALNDLYEDLFGFFVEFLGVRTLTLEMVYNKLVEQGRGQTPIKEVKDTIWLLNSYLQGEEEAPSPTQLLASTILPVKYPDRIVRLCSSAVEFTIIDRKHLSHYFSDQVKSLDFELNEIPRLAPFLRWTRLETRYLSSSVKEISAHSGESHRLTSPCRNIAQKAHGLLRIAVHFQSPRAMKNEAGFFEILKNIDVRETDGITSELHVNQDGKDIKVEVGQSELHLEDNDSGLKIYVPRNEKAQFLCFLDRMPRALLEWILTEPSTGISEPFDERALNVMQNLIQASSEYVSLALDRAGILSIETPEDPIHSDVDAAAPSDLMTTDGTHTTRATASSDSGHVSVWCSEDSTLSGPYDAPIDIHGVTTTFPGTTRDSIGGLSLSARSTQALTGHVVPLPSALETPSLPLDSEYYRLLRHVVSTAREAVFPSRGPFDMAALSHGLGAYISNSSDAFRLRTMEKIERDKRIGAAGELFIFELLSCLSPPLPSFSRDSWMSTIRHYVRVHEEYADLEPWHGRETADMLYADRDGIFTALLIDKGYLRADTWAGRRPTYYLEVKATTASWETPFYMSKYQHERLQNLSCGASRGGALNCVYVIFRVFNLGCDSVGVKVYVDPEYMRARKELSFTAETWSVTPGPCFGAYSLEDSPESNE